MNFQGLITEERLAQIKDTVKEKGMSVTFKDFLVCEIQLIIEQTVLTDDERKMAEYKYIRKMSNREIYFKMDWDSESSCYSHIKSISYDLRKTCQRLFI